MLIIPGFYVFVQFLLKDIRMISFNFSSIIIFLNTKLNVYLLIPRKITYASINSY